jgi:hypothetical protein
MAKSTYTPASNRSDEGPASDAFPVEKPAEPKIKGGDHPKPSTMRQDVAGKPQEDLSADIDSARTPYPVGSPPDPEDIFEEQHGYRKGS